MDQLERVVRAITKAASKDASGEVVAFGTRQDESLPEEWEAFFKRSRESLGLRKQEPAPEAEADPDVLHEILTRIVKRIEEIEARLAVIEAIGEIQERIEDQAEPVRKGEAEIEEGLEIAGQKSCLTGTHITGKDRRENPLRLTPEMRLISGLSRAVALTLARLGATAPLSFALAENESRGE